MNTIRLLKKINCKTIYVSVDFPVIFSKEFNTQPTPLLFHCFGRFAKLYKSVILNQLRLSVSITVSLFVCLFVLCFTKFTKKKLPFHFMECNMINCLYNSDIIMFSGGGYLTDKGKLECRACLLTALIGIFMRKKVMMVGQGIGPIDTIFTKWLLKLVLFHVQKIGIRDNNESFYFVNQILKLKTTNIVAIPDNALSLIPPQNRIIGNKIKTIAFHVRMSPFTPDKEKLFNNLESTLSLLINSGWNIVFFIFAAQQKWEADLIKNLTSSFPKKKFDIVHEEDPRVIAQKIGECDVAAGIAYHFSVFALQQGVPVLGLYNGNYYAQKMRGLFKWFNKESWLVPYDQLKADDFLNKINGLYLDKETYASELIDCSIRLSKQHDSEFYKILKEL